MSGELVLPLRGSEWRCQCAQGIRAASCAECVRCGTKRPFDTAGVMALTRDAIEALDVFKAALREHGNETAAMADVLVWRAGHRTQEAP